MRLFYRKLQSVPCRIWGPRKAIVSRRKQPFVLGLSVFSYYLRRSWYKEDLTSNGGFFIDVRLYFYSFDAGTGVPFAVSLRESLQRPCRNVICLFHACLSVKKRHFLYWTRFYTYLLTCSCFIIYLSKVDKDSLNMITLCNVLRTIFEFLIM